MTVSAHSAISDSAMPIATLAFHSRCAVHMHRQTALGGNAMRMAFNSATPLTTPPAPLVSILNADETRRRPVVARDGSQHPAKIVGAHHQPRGSHRQNLGTAQGRDAGDLTVDDMRVHIGDHLGPPRRMHPHGRLVCHGAAREEQRRLLSQESSDPFFESARGRITIALVVTNLGLGHRGPHGRRWFGDGVAPQIDRHVAAAWSCRECNPR